MRKVRCYECGKSYDYDDDGFCPNCGAFNLPWREAPVSAEDAVTRKEGINERNHKGSFLHAELHEENRKRKGTPLEQSMKRPAGKSAETRGGKKKQVSVVRAVIFAIIAFNLFLSLLEIL